MEREGIGGGFCELEDVAGEEAEIEGAGGGEDSATMSEGAIAVGVYSFEGSQKYMATITRR